MKFFEDKYEILLLIFFFIFSLWLMYKSFGYDSNRHMFRVARHQVGDFGLHLSLIRSFSWGDNFFPQSPFYPGKPLPYHYFFDFVVGMLERGGVRIDIALNGLSAFFFSMLLFLIYKLPQLLFKEGKAIGALSVLFFIFHSNFTFFDFLNGKEMSFALFRDLWRLPDYVHKGPFDGSQVLIFFTLNVYLNQRHFVVALAICLAIVYFLLSKLIKQKKISLKFLIMLGFILGITSRVHTITFLSTAVIIFLLFIVFRRFQNIVVFFLPMLLTFYFHLITILDQKFSHPFLNPGFLAQKPLTLSGFFEFWFLNLGIVLILIPLGFFFSNTMQRKFFLCVLPLFAIGNIFQLSFRIDHNHSLFNYFFIFANFYVAYALVRLWSLPRTRTVRGIQNSKRALIVLLIFLLTASGVVDLMAVKNDFQYTFEDAPRDKFMRWIKTNTRRNDTFIARQEILDPVTLAGRKNYLGHSYYLSVMGYDSSQREEFVKEVFGAREISVLRKAREEEIDYIVIPKKEFADFRYKINRDFFSSHLKTVYQDKDVRVFKL